MTKWKKTTQNLIPRYLQTPSANNIFLYAEKKPHASQ